ncbi:MAG: xanthine dehydrogenase family protein subunit M [Candidatus Celaenobacter polaris]|nr:xanthine dehydrogenase family protein subunit M [Candidatus Celaenobacter polaris]
MIIKDFKYIKPPNITEAVELLSTFSNNARILAGGTDLVVQMKENIQEPDAVIDIKGIEELHEILFEDNMLFIGACVTFSELIESEIIKKYFPLIKEMSETVASVGIRNRATLIGNICSAVPSADSAPILLVYNADIIAKSSSEERIIPIHDWFTGPKKTILRPDELVTSIAIRLPNKKHAGCYEKLGRYSGEDIAQAGVCILVFEDLHYNVAFCAVGPVPKRAYAVEKFLTGKNISEKIIEEATQYLLKEISPISDIRATVEYRTHMMCVMFERGLKKVVSRLHGGGNA